MRLFIEVLHYGVEAGAAGAGGDGDGVEIKLHGDDAATVAMAHLVGDVEDEGGVHTVVELHVDVHEVAVLVRHLVGTADVVGTVTRQSEGHESSADDVDELAVLVAVALHSGVVIDGDGVVAGPSGVDVGRAGQSREVARAVDSGDASPVVVQDDLRQIYIGNGAQHGLQGPDVGITLRVPDESTEVAVDLDSLLVGREQQFRLVERVGIAGSLVARRVHRLVGIGHDGVEARRLVKDEALHAVERLDVVPAEDVPEAPVVAAEEVVALHGVGNDAGMLGVRLVAGIVAAQVEHRRLGVAQFAEDDAVGLVPSVVPLMGPVVVDIDVVVPEHLQVEVDDRQVHVRLLGIVEVQRRFGRTGQQR